MAGIANALLALGALALIVFIAWRVLLLVGDIVQRHREQRHLERLAHRFADLDDEAFNKFVDEVIADKKCVDDVFAEDQPNRR
jgi:hypothetical protein